MLIGNHPVRPRDFAGLEITHRPSNVRPSYVGHWGALLEQYPATGLTVATVRLERPIGLVKGQVAEAAAGYLVLAQANSNVIDRLITKL